MAQIGSVLTPEAALRLAMAEARKGVGFVSPNPLVGCVIVDQKHHLLAQGFHRKLGAAHAEVDALNKIPEAERATLLVGATIYVTLEPCAHQGRTPSCARALARLPLKSVVYGLEDPNPLVKGKGADLLRDHGIEATAVRDFDAISDSAKQELVADLEELAEVFLCNMRENRTFVALKVASSLDGMMAMASGESKWITGEDARRHGRWLRAESDAVLIGRGTYTHDNPRLDIRLDGFQDRPGKAILLDPEGRSFETLPHSNLAEARSLDEVIIVTRPGLEKPNPSGIDVLPVAWDPQAGIDIDALLAALFTKGIMSILIEGGPRTLAKFMMKNAVDRLHLFIAPVLMGGKHGIPWARDFGGTRLADSWNLKGLRRAQLGEDIYLTGRLS